MVNEIVPSRDGVICKVIVQCRNDQENIDQYTTRSVRGLVLIHPIDKFNGGIKKSGINSEQRI